MKCYPSLVLLLAGIATFAHADDANHQMMQPHRSIVANDTVSAFTSAPQLAVSPESNHHPAGNGATNYSMQPHKSIFANETVLAFAPAAPELDVPPQSNAPPGGVNTAVSASNAVAREPIRGRPPEQAWLAAHKFDEVDFTLPTPDSFEDPSHRSLRRRLQQRVTTWACYNSIRKRYVDHVKIWWGHTKVDGKWACNDWRTGTCDKSCEATQVSNSHWNCYRQTDLKLVGIVNINWGHGVVDGVWACNNWVSNCVNSQGGCLVTGAPHWPNRPWSCNAYKSSNGCSFGSDWFKNNLKFACDQNDYCYYGPIKNDFWDTYRHCTNLFMEEVHRKGFNGGDIRITSAWYYKTLMTTDTLWNGGPVRSQGFGDDFQNRQLASDAECYLGKSKPQGYQRAPCQSGGSCGRGCIGCSSCWNCCDGFSDFVCNKPWWE